MLVCGYDVNDFGRYSCEQDTFIFFVDSLLLLVNSVVVAAGEIYKQTIRFSR